MRIAKIYKGKDTKLFHLIIVDNFDPITSLIVRKITTGSNEYISESHYHNEIHAVIKDNVIYLYDTESTYYIGAIYIDSTCFFIDEEENKINKGGLK